MIKPNQRRFCYDYTTAPSLRDLANVTGQMLPIKMKWDEICPFNLVKMQEQLRCGVIQACDGNGFREALPQILSGESTDWILWHVRILSQQLHLYYTKANYAPVPAADLVSGRPEDFGYGRIILYAPESIHCDFVIPPMHGEPEITVKYHFRREKLLAANTEEEATAWVSETRGDKLQFRERYRTWIPCQPQSQQSG